MEAELRAPRYQVDWEGGTGGGKHDFQVLGLSNWVDGRTSIEVMERRTMGWGQGRHLNLNNGKRVEWQAGLGRYRKGFHVFSLLHLNLRCLYRQGGISLKQSLLQVCGCQRYSTISLPSVFQWNNQRKNVDQGDVRLCSWWRPTEKINRVIYGGKVSQRGDPGTKLRFEGWRDHEQGVQRSHGVNHWKMSPGFGTGKVIYNLRKRGFSGELGSEARKLCFEKWMGNVLIWYKGGKKANSKSLIFSFIK